MKFLLAFVALFAFVSAPLSADKNDLDGYWWEKMDASFKLGWVSGYTKAMGSAYAMQLQTCTFNMPLYKKVLGITDEKTIVQKMCLIDNQADYESISMGQFVDGMDAFYKDYRNKQLDAGWAIQYARDSIKGKPAQALETEITLWRRCAAAEKSHADGAILSKACTPDK